MSMAEQFWIAWPWMGLGMAAVMLVVLFATDLCRSGACGGSRLGSRWHDPYWLAWLPMPVYLLHQFEEYSCHTADVPNLYTMVQFFYDTGGIGPLSLDGIPLVHFELMNIVLVWVGIPLGAWLARRWRNPAIGLVPYGFMLFNALTHVVGGAAGLVGPWYASPGIYTGVLLFAPLSAAAARSMMRGGGLTGRGVAVALLSGAAGHIALFGAYAANSLAGGAAMVAWDLVVAFAPLALSAALTKAVPGCLRS